MVKDMSEFNRLVVHNNGKLAFDMKRLPDGTWKTIYGPGFARKSKKRSKKGRFASLRRKHTKWLNR